MKPLPKIELHLHLEGAMRPETVRHLSLERLGWTGPLPEDWPERYYTYTDFAGFMDQLTPRFPGRPDEYARIAAECFEDLAALNVVYSDVSFDLPSREIGDHARFWPIVEALEEERRKAEARWPIRINFVAGLMRTLGPEVAIYRVKLAAEARERGIGIVAVDLHGDETRGEAAAFAQAYDLAESLDFGLRAHAGEAKGPESMWAAIDVLGVRQIPHGVRAVEDERLLRRLDQGDVTLLVCPTSNVRTAVVPSLAAHPIRQLYDRGIPVTANSDDPLPFFTDIEREYRLLVDEFGFGRDDLRRVVMTAARCATLPVAERQELENLIERTYGAPDGTPDNMVAEAPAS